MDSLKSLMDRKEYELVIKLTDKTDDMNFLFYRISAFLALSKGEDALNVIKTNRKILEGDPSLLIKIHIEILCLLGKFEEAEQELNYYENMPYVSQEVEELLRDLPKYIKEEEKKSFNGKNYSIEDLKEKLQSNNQDDVLPALDLIRDRDIGMFYVDIQRVMVSFPKQSIRSFALLLLVQKRVDKNFVFNHMGNNITVNPSKLEPPFIGEDFNSFLRDLQAELKNPSANETAVQIISSYIIYTYPEPLKEDPVIQIEALRKISFEYLQIGEDVNLERRCIEKGIKVEDVENLIQRISNAINDF